MIASGGSNAPRVEPSRGGPARNTDLRKAIWVYVIAAIVLTFVLILGTTAALIGHVVWEKRDRAQLERESTDAATELAQRIVTCAQKTGALPPTSNPVPARFEEVIDTTYVTRDDDWLAAAWECAGFRRARQGFQIRWIRESSSNGYAIAIAKQRDVFRLWTNPVDFEVRLHLECSSAGRCMSGMPVLTTAPRGLEDGAF